MSVTVAIRCRNCGARIVGCAETRHGYGWVHERTNAEACARGDTRALIDTPGRPGRTHRVKRGRYAVPEI